MFVEPDPMFGQLCCGAVLLRGVVVDLLVVAAGDCDFELPFPAANAAPPPATTPAATASARMRLIRVISPPFDAWLHQSSRT
jgi:hypothetical protein